MTARQSGSNSENLYVREQLGTLLKSAEITQKTIQAIEDRQVQRTDAARTFEDKMLEVASSLKHDIANVKQTVYPRLEELKIQLDAQKVQLDAARVQLDSHQVKIESHITRTSESFVSLKQEISDTHTEQKALKEKIDSLVTWKAVVLAVSTFAMSAIAVVWAVGQTVWKWFYPHVSG